VRQGLCPALGIKTGSKVALINPPAGFVQGLNPLPEGVEFLVTATTGLDVILFFTEDPKELVERLPALCRASTLQGGIWICWPSGNEKARITEDFIRQAALALGLTDEKRLTFDMTWSGLRLVRRSRGKLEKPESRKLPTAQA
jgi:hypothetical protein